MEQNYQRDIFEKRKSSMTARLAFSTPACDFTYGTLARTISAIGSYIVYYHPVRKGHKVAVMHERRDETLLILLALIKIQVEVILIDPGIPDDEVRDILAGTAPDLLLLGKDQPDTPRFGCPVLKLNSEDTYRYEKDDGRISLEEINAAMTWRLYQAGEGGYLSVTAKSLEEDFRGIGKIVSPVRRDRYLIAGVIPFGAFIRESLWCLWNGVHLLSFPFRQSVISELTPDAKRFPMDFTLFFFGSAKDDPGEEECYELLMNCVKHADHFDYSGVWTPERHFNEFGGKYPNPGILSAAIAAITSQVQIRSGSIVSPLHHVLRIAEDWSVIDNLSGGRTALSFASGWQCNDFVFYPDRYARRHETMLEQIGDFRKLWAGEKLEFNNGAGDKIKVGIYPKPIQQEMPIWVTVSGRIETFVDAGRIGANILTHLLWQDPGDLVGKIAAYRDSLRENGYPPASRTVSVMLHTYVGTDAGSVRKLVEKPLKDYIRSSLHLIEAMTHSAKMTKGENAIGRYGRNVEEMSEEMKEELLEFAFERFLSGTSLIGDPVHCGAILEMLRSYGVDELACLVDFGLDNASILEGLNGLRELKDRYHSARLKKYSGGIILRASRENLLQLIEGRPEDIDRCRRIVTDRESGEGSIGSFCDTEDYLNQLSRPAGLSLA